MDLHLTVSPSDHVAIHVNGQFVAEVAATTTDTRDDLQALVHQARCLRALPQLLRSLVAELARCGDLPDHVNVSARAKREAYQRGLIDGLLQRTVGHPYGTPLPALHPEYSPSYARAYEYASALVRCLGQGGEEEPKDMDIIG